MTVIAALMIAQWLGPGVAGAFGPPASAGWALLLALGAALPWTLAAVPLIWIIQWWIPRPPGEPSWVGRITAPVTLQTLLGLLSVASAELLLAYGAARLAREHHVPTALALTAAVPVALAIAAHRIPRAKPIPYSPLARLLPAGIPVVLALTLPDHVLAHGFVLPALTAAAILPYATRLPLPPPWIQGGLAALLLVASLTLGLGLGRQPGVAATLLARHWPTQQVVRWGRRWTDFDGDGSSSAFGGRDCAPWDPRRGPYNDELADNGVDDNCLLGDLRDDRDPVVQLEPVSVMPTSPRPNVLVLVVDALRPDRMSHYGYGRATTEHITRHFAEGIRFTRAYSESASTRDTLPSLLSGRHRAQLPWLRHPDVALEPKTRTLAHHLQQQGWDTLAVLPFVALNMIGGTDLGFRRTQLYDDHRSWSAPEVNRKLLAALASAERPFFALAHYYEPHEPYRAHPAHRAVSPDPYDQEIAAVDGAIGELLDTLRTQGELEHAIVILVSDHGEAFGEHGHRFHNQDVYEEDLRVPWLMLLSDGRAQDVDEPVSTTALAATLLELLHVPLPAAMGPTVPAVTPLLLGQERIEPVVSVARPELDGERFALIDGSEKLMFDRMLSAFEVYDLARDPGEKVDLSATDPARTDRLIAQAEQWLESTLGRAASRRLRARIHDAPVTGLRVPPIAMANLVGVKLELTRPRDRTGLPPRILVRIYRDSPAPNPLTLRLGPPGGRSVPVPPLPLALADLATDHEVLETVLALKVYDRDFASRLALATPSGTWELGALEELFPQSDP